LVRKDIIFKDSRFRIEGNIVLITRDKGLGPELGS